MAAPSPVSTRPPRLRALHVVAFYAIVVGVAVGWSWARGDGLWFDAQGGDGALFRLPDARGMPGWLAGALWAGALIGGTLLAERHVRPFQRLSRDLAEAVAPATWPRVILFALASGLAEEALFRGPFQAAFGFIAASLVFALLHGGVSVRYLPWSTFALVAGLGFGTLAGAYRSIWPGVIAHVLVNLVNLRRLGDVPLPESEP